MPNRILKESICTSGTIDSLSPDEELFFYRLLVQCDDFGRMDARPAVLRARCYPLRVDKISNAAVTKWLSALRRVGLVAVYEVNGQSYLQVATWDRHQQMRAKRSKYPAGPTQPLADASMCNQTLADDSICPRNPNPNPNPKEHTCDADASHMPDPTPPQTASIYSADFVAFWNAYPRKVNKRGAYRCWRARLKERLESGEQITPELLITAGRVYATACSLRHTEPEFIKHPASFLSRDHPFAEYLRPPMPAGEPVSDPFAKTKAWLEACYGTAEFPSEPDGPRT